MRMLNLGCGTRLHPDWTNIDFVSGAPGVIAHNLTTGVPAADASADVVYHSHVLEHLSRSGGQQFIAECFRVLKPGGVIRVAIPDLERIAKGYVEALDKARNGEAGWDNNYDWTVLEMYDQTVRNETGGDMARYLRQSALPNEQFILSRNGEEARRMIAMAKVPKTAVVPPTRRRSLIRGWGIRQIPSRLHRRLLQAFLGDKVAALKVGQFRLEGEIHQWMYDEFSLGRLLKQIGFIDVTRRAAAESVIPAWPGYNLDTNPDGSIYKPDSLFMEARKPA